ncbi:MAG TPA: manganese catalase [Clostridiales bacterium]|nr:manganese catalase [Clostridiales bacterium]
MFEHKKQLLHEVKVEKANPQYAVLMQEQLGGGNGELKAALQYMSQSFRIKDPEIKDLFLDIAAEELSHMEMVATTINLLNGHDVDYKAVDAGEIQSHVILGLSPGLINSSGYSWNADYVTVTGDLVADLLSNIASEQRAKVVYEYLYRQIEDKEVRATIDFLLNREEAHNALFREALNKVQNSGSNKDFGVTEDSKLYFNLSNPGPEHKNPNPTPVSFESPTKG